MNGKELIVYILRNNLESEPVFKDGKFIGFITEAEAAEKMNVGVATIRVWINQDIIEGIRIGDTIFVPANFESSLEEYAKKS